MPAGAALLLPVAPCVSMAWVILNQACVGFPSKSRDDKIAVAGFLTPSTRSAGGGFYPPQKVLTIPCGLS
jgi:hypothetical protein